MTYPETPRNATGDATGSPDTPHHARHPGNDARPHATPASPASPASPSQDRAPRRHALSASGSAFPRTSDASNARDASNAHNASNAHGTGAANRGSGDNLIADQDASTPPTLSLPAYASDGSASDEEVGDLRALATAGEVEEYASDEPTEVMRRAESGEMTQITESGAEIEDELDVGRASSPSSSAVRQGVKVRAATPTLPRRASTDKSRWKVLGAALAALLVLAGIGVFAYSRFTEPAQAASTFCHDLQTHGYAQAYALLSGTAAADGLSATQFADAARTLDAAEGSVTACGQEGAYGYALGGSTATVALALTRGHGAHLQGTLRLADVRGAWKITSAPSSLFGVNLIALTTATSYCADMRTQNYSAAYALLDAGTQGQTSASDFTQQARDHDTLDGPVTACAVVGVARGNTNASATLTTRITRQRLGARVGNITLATQGHTDTAWRVRQIDTTLQGSDLGGLQTTRRFCDDLGAGNYDDAYGLFSANLSGQMGSASASAAFLDGQDGLKWVGCVPQVPTYAVSGSGATLAVQLTLQNSVSGQQGTGPAILNLVRENAGWHIDNISFPSVQNS